MLRWYIKLNIALIFLISFSLQAMDFNKITGQYCLHRLTKGFKKTLKDGTPWGFMIATNLSKSFGDRDKFIILRNSTLIGTMGTIIKNSLPRKTRKTFNTLLSGSIFNTLSLDCPFATSLLISNFFISGCQKDDIILNLLIGGYIFSIWADNYLLSHKKKAPKYTDNEVTITEDLYSIDE